MLATLLAAIAFSGPAAAQEEAPAAEAPDAFADAEVEAADPQPEGRTPEPESSAPSAPSGIDLGQAEAAPQLSSAQLDWLKPTPRNLPQNPYGHVDFTAYALEWGELQVGSGGIHLGVLPRVQVSTSPLLDVAGLYNVRAKANVLRLGPVDLAADASVFRLPEGDLDGSYTGVGGMMSVRVLRPWSIHVSGQYGKLAISGLPEVSGISPLIYTLTGTDIAAWREEAAQQGVNLELDAEAVTLKVATDLRFNRRDSLILQGQAMVWGSLNTGASADIEIPPVLGLDQALSQDKSGYIPLSEAYVGSLSYQWSWKRAYLRVGAGLSSVKGAWLLQSTEYAMRFGGKTRWSEKRMRQGWRANRKDLRRGGEAEVASAPAPAPEPAAAE